MLFYLFMGICLTFIGVVTLVNEEKLIQFERAIGRAFKRLFSKPQAVAVIPSETDAQKQARFNSGKLAGDELYGHS